MKRAIDFVLTHSPWFIAGILLIALILTVPAFQRPYYWLSLPPQYFAPAALALALTPVILTGGIDLSVGSLAVLSSVVVGILWRDMGLPLGVAMAAGVLAGLVAGLTNGVLVSWGILPLVATLATRELFRGLAWTLSGSDSGITFPASVSASWGRPIAGLALASWVLLGLALSSYLVIHHTWPGRMLFALGDNAVAARYAGVPVAKIQLGLYAWTGLVAGVCGVALVMKYGSAKADAERSLELLAIACVVMGGVRVTGGSGHVAGTVLGIITVCALNAGLGQVSAAWRDTVTGSVLLLVALAGEAGRFLPLSRVRS